MDHQAVDQAVAAMLGVLAPRVDGDWTVAAGPLDWDCRATAAHIAHDLLAYAAQVTARPSSRYLPLDLTVRPDATAADVLQVAAAAGGLLSGALRLAGPEVRAWHWGPCDPTGFAAMGVAEVLLHTHDIAQGLGLAWEPPAHLAVGVLDRLFPEAPSGDPVQVLLWCTGRGELPGRRRRASWTWRAAVD